MMQTEFRNGLDVLREYETRPKLTTGSLDLDSLLAGGIEQGSFTVIYGDNECSIDQLLYTLLSHCQLPVERYGLNGKSVLLSCGDYRQEQVLVDLKLASAILKGSGIDPAKGQEEIIAVTAFNADQAEQSAEDILNIIKYHDQVKLVVVRNLAKLFIENAIIEREDLEKLKRFQHLIASIWQACSERGVTLVMSCRPRRPNRFRPSPPEGGTFLRHLAQTILCIKKRDGNRLAAHLLKHPNRQPRTVEFEYSQSDSVMGRLTIPFRSQLQQEMENLTRSFKEALMEPARRDAFDSLTRAWTAEQGAMSYAKVPSVLEVMLLAAAVDNRKNIEDMQDEIALLRSQLEKTRSELAEAKINIKTLPGVTD
jgi:RecA/RadA recombinase